MNPHLPVYMTWTVIVWMCMCACCTSMNLSLWSIVAADFFWASGAVGVGFSAFFNCPCQFSYQILVVVLLFSNHSLCKLVFSRSCLIIKSSIWCFACLWHHFNKCVCWHRVVFVNMCLFKCVIQFVTSPTLIWQGKYIYSHHIYYFYARRYKYEQCNRLYPVNITEYCTCRKDLRFV